MPPFRRRGGQAEGGEAELDVICPSCGRVGRLYYTDAMGFYVKHGRRGTHPLTRLAPLELALPRGRPLTLVRYFGGDARLLKYLAKMVPAHLLYVEVFGGGAAFLLNKPPSPMEVYNDADGLLVNLFRVVRDRYCEFMRRASLVLYSRREYYEALRKLESGEAKDEVERALLYFIAMRGAYGGVYGAPFSVRRRPGRAAVNEARLFWNAVKRVRKVHYRLRNVVIEDLDFRECIMKYDGEHTFFYLDPPHLYEANEALGGMAYRARFTEADYMDLLSLLERVRGKFLLKQVASTPYVALWARRNGLCVKEVRYRRGLPARGRADEVVVQFMANYSLDLPPYC